MSKLLDVLAQAAISGRTVIVMWDRPGGPPGNGLRAATPLEEASHIVSELNRTGYVIVPKDDSFIEDDEELADKFHAELKRQQAFSIERHGTIALAEAPFMRMAYEAAMQQALAALIDSRQPETKETP